ncbi:MAG: ABC-F family ATP-binding cassette domain-containing protein [Agathobacter sp.]|nr:ABC-F family ATP-binding cassette domain-containing protein [Agathobacter sp.]
MLYQIRNGTVSAGGQVILSHIDFEVKGREKIAVVGSNGAGKTTLLRLIAGELELDRDDRQHQPAVVSSRDFTIGMLRQINTADADKTVEELLMEGFDGGERFSREEMAYRAEYDRLFTGFGFSKDMKGKRLSEFSGGEQTKISLIHLLLMKPELLLLDEPTNNLDIQTVEWLEEYMREYPGAVVFVSHDRFFLDQVVDVVYELSRGRLKRYAGNYSHYRKQKLKDIELQRKAYEKQQEEIARLNALIEKFKHKPSKASFARSRKTMLERMKQVEPPQEDEVHIFTGQIQPSHPGSKWVMEAEHLKIGYEEALLEISLRVRRGQKIGIIGDNGAGKSTFLKTIAGLVEPLEGSFSMGNNVLMGYFDQHSAALDSDKTVAEHYHDLFPVMTEKEVRHNLGAYLFSGAEVSKRVSSLSGGERARLVLCELMSSRPNLMLLDEPTNHMDIRARETLESAFKAYSGTMLFVSHDRYFISQVADAILVFQGEEVLYYPFGYQHYIERKRRGSSDDMIAMIQAEDQAMIADLKAVPKPERHRLKEIGTEEGHIDWKLRLEAEPMEEAMEQVEAMVRYMNEAVTLEQYEGWERKLEHAYMEWTETCLQWYDMWLEMLG